MHNQMYFYLRISGVFQLCYLIPSIVENVAIDEDPAYDFNRKFHFPYSLLFGGLGATILLMMGIAYYVINVIKIFRNDAKKTDKYQNQHQTIALIDYPSPN